MGDFKLVTRAMYRLSLVAAPVGIWYAVKNVERVAVRGGEYDRYAITFDEWEQATVERAFEVAKGRQPSQLIASAFYRSPAFALERVGLGYSSGRTTATTTSSIARGTSGSKCPARLRWSFATSTARSCAWAHSPPRCAWMRSAWRWPPMWTALWWT